MCLKAIAGFAWRPFRLSSAVAVALDCLYVLGETTEVATATCRGVRVYAVARSYSGQGASEVFDLVAERDEEVKALLRGVPGFVSYVAFRSGDGGVTVTVCDDEAGTRSPPGARPSSSRKTSARRATRP